MDFNSCANNNNIVMYNERHTKEGKEPSGRTDHDTHDNRNRDGHRRGFLQAHR